MRDELLPACLGVAPLTPGEGGAEIFDVHLPSRPVERKLLQRQATGFDDQDGLVAVGAEGRLEKHVELIVLFSTGDHQLPRRFAALDASRAVPTRAVDQEAVLP